MVTKYPHWVFGKVFGYRFSSSLTTMDRVREWIEFFDGVEPTIGKTKEM
jgi:spore cortex formation protein SpoVR/YcgB (stage V sporulation)